VGHLDHLKEFWPIYLGPIQSQAQIPHLTTLLATHPFPAKGVHGASRTGSNESQCLSARSRNNLSGGYTSHDFVTDRAWCAITTALQPSTSIYRGLVAVPNVESSSPLNPHSLISTDLSVRVSAGTPPRRSKSDPNAFHHHSNHRQTPSDQVRVAPSVENTSSPHFYPC